MQRPPPEPLTQPQELCNLLKTNRPADRDAFFRRGALLDDPVFSIIYNTELCHESFRKLVCCQDGRFQITSAPVGLILNCDWRIWELKNNGGDSILIAYDPQSQDENVFWREIRAVMSDIPSVPFMFGDLVVFRFGKPVNWTPKELQRELMTFVATRYGHLRADHKFST